MIFIAALEQKRLLQKLTSPAFIFVKIKLHVKWYRINLQHDLS